LRNVLLRSVMLAMLVIPFVAAREPHPVRALKKALALFVGLNVLYMLALRFLYPYLS
jgi:hypothetical protein